MRKDTELDDLLQSNLGVRIMDCAIPFLTWVFYLRDRSARRRTRGLAARASIQRSWRLIGPIFHLQFSPMTMILRPMG